MLPENGYKESEDRQTYTNGLKKVLPLILNLSKPHVQFLSNDINPVSTQETRSQTILVESFRCIRDDDRQIESVRMAEREPINPFESSSQPLKVVSVVAR